MCWHFGILPYVSIYFYIYFVIWNQYMLIKHYIYILYISNIVYAHACMLYLLSIFLTPSGVAQSLMCQSHWLQTLYERGWPWISNSPTFISTALGWQACCASPIFAVPVMRTRALCMLVLHQLTYSPIHNGAHIIHHASNHVLTLLLFI